MKILYQFNKEQQQNINKKIATKKSMA